MKLLIISSGNRGSISPITKNQVDSIITFYPDIIVDYYLIKGKGLFGYLKNITKIRQKINSFKPNIIHAHFGSSGIVALLAKKRQKIIVSFMGDDLLGSNNSDGTYSWSSRFLARINIILAKFFYDYSIVKSEILAQRLIRKTKHTIIPNGVNIETFRPISIEDFNIQKDIVLFASNPSRKEKNYNLAKKGVELLNDDKVELKIVYNISQKELNEQYSQCKVLLLTSFHEGSPNVIKEAMASGCPIVSTDVGDVRWVIGKTEGCFITNFDPEDVALKIKKALEFSKERIRTDGRQRIIDLGLDSETIANKIVTLYNSVLNKA